MADINAVHLPSESIRFIEASEPNFHGCATLVNFSLVGANEKNIGLIVKFSQHSGQISSNGSLTETVNCLSNFSLDNLGRRLWESVCGCTGKEACQ